MKKGVITNTVCITTAIICIALTFWGNLKNDGVLSTDAYMGVIATLIGICATIVVGFQIVSFIELQNSQKKTNQQLEQIREQQQTLNAEREDLNKDRRKLEKQLHFTQGVLGNVSILLCKFHEYSDQQDLLGAYSYIYSIALDPASSASVLLARYEKLYKFITNLSSNNEDLMPIKSTIHLIKDIQVPENWPEHNAIMKIHYEILAILDKVSDDEPAAETEQK